MNSILRSSASAERGRGKRKETDRVRFNVHFGADILYLCPVSKQGLADMYCPVTDRRLRQPQLCDPHT